MPRLDTARAKTRSPTSSPPPTSPHRVKLPATPAAVARPNPIDATASRLQQRASVEPTTKSSGSSANAKVVHRAATLEPVHTPTPVETTTKTPIAPLKPALTDEEIMDMEIFNQILDMDDDPDDREFSPSIVVEYLNQASETFDKMDKALQAKELDKLASMGHFLKGSSAALGIIQVRNSCEKIQNYGHLRGDDPDGKEKLSPEEALKRIKSLIIQVREEHEIGKKWLEDYYKGALANVVLE